MKILRRLPEDPGKMVRRITTYQKGMDEYLVLEDAGGRLILLDEQGAEDRALGDRADVRGQEEIQDPGSSETTS